MQINRGLILIKAIKILNKSIFNVEFVPVSVVAAVVEGVIGLSVVGAFEAGFKVVSGLIFYARTYSYIQNYFILPLVARN